MPLATHVQCLQAVCRPPHPDLAAWTTYASTTQRERLDAVQTIVPGTNSYSREKNYILLNPSRAKCLKDTIRNLQSKPMFHGNAQSRHERHYAQPALDLSPKPFPINALRTPSAETAPTSRSVQSVRPAAF